MPEIKNNILAVLSTLEVKGNTVKITEQLDRKLYLSVNEVLERIGGKWNRKAKVHIFNSDPTDRLESVINSGMLDPKIKTGYFPTPPEIVKQMIELLELKQGDVILEPSAGQGHIADEVAKITGKENIFCIELLKENTDILKQKGYEVLTTDFLKWNPHPIDNSSDKLENIQMGTEIWHPVIGYESIYEVSSIGRIRRIQNKKGRIVGRFLTPSKRSDGYLNVVLSDSGKIKNYLLHKIVADAFLGKCPEGMQINHKHPDGDKSRCWVSNLEYRTSAENNEDQRKHRPTEYAIRNEHPKSILKPEDLPNIRRRLFEGDTPSHIATDYGVVCGTITAIDERRSWSIENILYKKIILNPPFEKQQDIDHVTHAFNMLSTGGILVSIMSAGVLFRNNNKTKKFREEILSKAQIIELPEGSFKSSGTMVRTIIIKIRKC